MKFRGKIYEQPSNPYASLIRPWVYLKQGFQQVYHLILQAIWSELIYGKSSDNELANLILFIGFCFLSWLTYIFQDYYRIFLFVSLGIWVIDGWVAKNTFLHHQKEYFVALDTAQQDTLLWRRQLPSQETISQKITTEEIQQLTLSLQKVYGGAFQEMIGEIWQLEMMFYDQTLLLLGEFNTINEAFQEATKLEQLLQVPLIFKNSEGIDLYAEKDLMVSSTMSASIRCQKTPSKWHISSHWRLSHSWQLLRQILQESGFFLFILIFTGLMVKFGAILNSIFLLSTGETRLNVPYLEDRAFWEFNTYRLIELVIVVGILFYKGYQVSREKHVIITKDTFSFFVNNRRLAQFSRQDIDSVLLLQDLPNTVLVLSKDSELFIEHLNATDIQSFCYYLSQGLLYFKKT